jgi:spore coat polysaccharide biosynthesis predicted glycosyltransferase SpsG
MSEGWLVRAASRPEVGAGHVSRCRVLARALARHAPTTLVIDDDGWRERLAGEPFAVQTAAGAAEGALAGAVVDSYALGDAEWAALRRRARVLAQLDDFLAPRKEADVSINAAPHLEGTALGGRLALLGPGYALVDPRYALSGRAAAERVDHMLTSFGASDPGDATGLALAALGLARLDVRIVVALGSQAPHLAAVRRRAEALGAELIVDAPDLVEQLARSDLALGAGGVGLLERMAAGVPSLSFALAGNQQLQLSGAAAKGATRYLGAAAEASAEALSTAIVELAGDRPAREAMSRRGRALVDGRGGERTAAALLELARRAA